jgi:hypothetical protein
MSYNAITGKLYLGSYDGIFELLKTVKITHIITVANTGEFEKEMPFISLYKPLSFKTGCSEISDCMDIVADFINEHDVGDNRIYIHCYEGVSRSAVCVLWYLLKYKNNGMTFDDIYGSLKEKRKTINISPYLFDIVLQKFIYEIS